MSIDSMIYPACYDELRAVSLDSVSLAHYVGALTPGMPGAHVCCVICRKAHDCLYGILGKHMFGGQYGVTGRAILMSVAGSGTTALEIGAILSGFTGSDIAPPEIIRIVSLAH